MYAAASRVVRYFRQSRRSMVVPSLRFSKSNEPSVLPDKPTFFHSFIAGSDGEIASESHSAYRASRSKCGCLLAYRVHDMSEQNCGHRSSQGQRQAEGCPEGLLGIPFFRTVHSGEQSDTRLPHRHSIPDSEHEVCGPLRRSPSNECIFRFFQKQLCLEANFD